MIVALWTLPQNLIGAILFLFCCRHYKGKYERAYVCKLPRNIGGVTLGNFIFLGRGASEITLKHEYGHTLQSYRLGWLYLLVIGLPSIIWAGGFKKYRKKTGKSYYSLYTEKWADRLGGVQDRS